MTSFKRDDNRIPIQGGVSNIDQTTLVPQQMNPATGAAEVEGSFIPSAIYVSIGNSSVAVSYAKIDIASSGDNTIISGVSSKKITVMNGLLIATSSVAIKFTDGTSDLTGAMTVMNNGGFVIPYAPTGNFQTASGNPLIINLGSAIQVSGWVAYVAI